MDDDTLVCTCNEVNRGEILKAIREKGLKTVDQAGDITEAGTGCGGCQDTIQEILDEFYGV